MSFAKKAFFCLGQQKGGWPMISFGLPEYIKYGLLLDDTRKRKEDLHEATRRLPKKERAEREFRISRAMRLHFKKEYLPRDQWTTVEENFEKGRYLEKCFREMEREELLMLQYEEEFMADNPVTQLFDIHKYLDDQKKKAADEEKFDIGHNKFS